MPTMRRPLLFVFVIILFGISLPVRAQTPLRFVAVTACRVADTRWVNGDFGGPPIPEQGSRDFAIPNGPCTIPSTAAAYSLNVAVVPHGPLGYLAVWPTGQQRPLVATLNSLDGRIKADAVIVPAGSNEAISVFATNTTDVVLDINGYFVPATDPSAFDFFPLTPCRVADTRKDTFPSGLGPPFLTGLQKRDFPILNAAACNIPASAVAYSLNFAVAPHGPLGYMTVWPTGKDRPVVSTLNDIPGTIIANAAIVPAGDNGEISVYPTTDTDLVIDINGYFAPPASGSLSLYVLSPCRVLDTRQTTGAFSGKLPVDIVDSSCAVPNAAQAFVLNASVVTQGALGYLTLWPDGQDRPLVSTLNALDGSITSNMAIVPTTNGWVDAFASGTTQLILDIFSYFAAITPGLPLPCTGPPEPPITGVINWSQFRYLPSHTGCNPHETVLSPATVVNLGLRWKYATRGYVSSSPAVANGVAYVGGGGDNNVYALNASTGALLWQYTTGNSVFSSPAVANGVVYVGSYDSNLYALNASTGALLWRYTAGSYVSSSPAVANGVVYVGSGDNNLYALNASTGALLWKYTTGDGVYSSPAVANGVVYVHSSDNNVYALNASTGALVWRYTTGSYGSSSPAVANGVVYVGSDDNNVYALNASTGALLWKYTTGGVVESSPAVANGVVYVGSYDSHVYALSADTGELMWRYTTVSDVGSSPAVANGVVYIGSEENNVYALNASTGALLWHYTTGATVSSSPAVANGVVYVGSGDGNVYAFGL